MKPFHVGLISRTFYYLPVWAAKDNGFFEAEGLDVELSFLGSDAQRERLGDGRLDVAIAPPEGVLQDVEAGGSLRLLAGNSGKLSHWLMAQPDIKKVEDLRGRVFGILSKSEGSFFHFQELAEAHGLSYPGDYIVKNTGGAPDRHAALQDGSIDAGLQSVPWCYLARDLGFTKLADISDYIPEWQFNTVNADARRAQRQPEPYVAFLRALLQGVEWVYGNADAAASVAAQHMNITSAYARDGWDYFTSNGKLTRDMSITFPGLAKVVDAQIKAGLLAESSRADLDKYVDTTFLKQAQAAVHNSGS